MNPHQPSGMYSARVVQIRGNTWGEVVDVASGQSTELNLPGLSAWVP